MTIQVNLDLMLVKRGVKLTELAEAVGITLPNLSILKTNKARAIRFSTLNAICGSLTASLGTCSSTCPPLRRERNGSGSAAEPAALKPEDDLTGAPQGRYQDSEDEYGIIVMTKTWLRSSALAGRSSSL